MSGHRETSARQSFAETAREAWSEPAGAGARLRSSARGAVLGLAARSVRPAPDFVRCLYAHAVFPEHRTRFRDFLRGLKETGDFIDTATLIELAKQPKPRGRYFHLSFDDGFANVYEAGGEVLLAEKVPATIFVATDLIEAGIERLADYFRNMTAYAAPVRTMTWAQVREASAAGIEIGSHTRSHARLSAISRDSTRLTDEVAGAKAIIERETGRSCTSFAWPYGTAADIDATALAAIRDAGYRISFSAIRGRVEPGHTDLLQVPRHQVELHWPPAHARAWAMGFREPRA